MNKLLGIAAVIIMVGVPAVSSAHGRSAPVSCTVDAVATGGGLVYGSGPMAPGWNVNLPDGGQGGSIKYIPYNGTTCIFNQGCMVAK